MKAATEFCSRQQWPDSAVLQSDKFLPTEAERLLSRGNHREVCGIRPVFPTWPVHLDVVAVGQEGSQAHLHWPPPTPWHDTLPRLFIGNARTLANTVSDFQATTTSTTRNALSLTPDPGEKEGQLPEVSPSICNIPIFKYTEKVSWEIPQKVLKKKLSGSNSGKGRSSCVRDMQKTHIEITVMPQK